MKEYRITRIEEPDFGCEGRPEDLPVMDKVWLEDETGREIIIEEADERLYEMDLNEGDMVFYGEDGLKR